MLYLHKRGIIHRDLKSPNLLVESTWKVKVGGDLGSSAQHSSHCCDSPALPALTSAPSFPGPSAFCCLQTAQVADFNLSKIVEDTGSGRSTVANMNPRWLVRRRCCAHADAHMHAVLMLLLVAAGARAPGVGALKLALCLPACPPCLPPPAGTRDSQRRVRHHRQRRLLLGRRDVGAA